MASAAAKVIAPMRTELIAAIATDKRAINRAMRFKPASQSQEHFEATLRA